MCPSGWMERTEHGWGLVRSAEASPGSDRLANWPSDAEDGARVKVLKRNPRKQVFSVLSRAGVGAGCGIGRGWWQGEHPTREPWVVAHTAPCHMEDGQGSACLNAVLEFPPALQTSVDLDPCLHALLEGASLKNAPTKGPPRGCGTLYGIRSQPSRRDHCPVQQSFSFCRRHPSNGAVEI